VNTWKKLNNFSFFFAELLRNPSSPFFSHIEAVTYYYHIK